MLDTLALEKDSRSRVCSMTVDATSGGLYIGATHNGGVPMAVRMDLVVNRCVQGGCAFSYCTFSRVLTCNVGYMQRKPCHTAM